MSTSADRNQAKDSPAFLAGGGEMGERIRSFDWESTSLGAPEQWPQSLKTAIRIMLTSRQPIWIGWGQELIYFYNDPYKSIIGGKHPRMLGQPTSVVWSEIWDVIRPMLEKAMEGDEGTYVESQLLIMHRNAYPEETYYTFSYSPIPNDDGTTGGIICANTDDTQGVIGERQLGLLRNLAAETANVRSWEEACERSAAALATNPEDLPFALIYIEQPDGAGLTLAGATGIEPGHAAAPELVMPGDGGPWPLDRVMADREVVKLEDLGKRFGVKLPTLAWPDPSTSAALVPISSSGRTGYGGVLVVGLNPYRQLDESYQNFLILAAGQISASIASGQAYEEERRRAEALAELDRTKTAFFSNVSHEFRTPLTLMLGPIEDLLSSADSSLDQTSRSQLEIVHRNSLRLLKLVNTMLDFSRIEAGRMQARFEPVDLSAFTAELAGVFRTAIERAGVTYRIECEPMPKQAYVDPDLWEKIVLNLLSNAFKFTLDGEIVVQLVAEGDDAVLRVRDTGVGIAQDQIEQVFERFHRVKGALGRTHEGTGIGLALVQELVKLHGGAVSLRSEVGEGSTFEVRIPLGSGHAIKTGVKSRPSGAAAEAYVQEAIRWLPGMEDEIGAELVSLDASEDDSPSSAERARVIWADDNADMRDYVARLLSKRFEVLAVSDGQAALEAARAKRPDLILSDVMMPRLDGYGLLRGIREDPLLKSVPIILLSARAGEGARIEGVASGADDYLVKPFSARELLARVESHVRMAREREAAHNAIRQLNTELEVRIAERTAELVSANEQLQGFSYSVAHDLRQQIRGINTNASILLLDLGKSLDDEAKATLQRLINSARKLGTLVDDLLSYARLGRQAPKAVQVDLSALANEITHYLRQSGRCSEATTFVIAEGLTAKADSSMVRIVLENLLDNACKYSADRRKPVIEFGRDGEAFFVRDNGIGFDMQFSHKLFQPFERLHRDSEFSGTGIGLANVKRIVEKHGGAIWADSEPEHGATFYFTLPE